MQKIKLAYVGLLSLSFLNWETCIWLLLALLLGINMDLKNIDPKMCYYTSKKNRVVPYKKRTVLCKKRTLPLTKRTVPCIDNLYKNRPKTTIEAFLRCNKLATSIHSLIDHVARWRWTEIIANQSFNIQYFAIFF